MSLVPTFVKMADEKWYQNPVLYDKEGDWFLCFDDDSPPELVMMQLTQLSVIVRKTILKQQLEKIGVEVSDMVHSTCGRRCFPPTWDKFKQAINAFIKIEKAIDFSNLEIAYDNVYNERPEVQGCFYEW